MSNNQPPSPDPLQPTRCNLCRELKQDVHINVCMSCVEVTLCRLMPRLTDTLEERYGHQLDEGLEAGRFTSAAWMLRPQYQVSEERTRRFVKNIVTGAFDQGAIALSLPHSDGWTPSLSVELADAVYCRHLTECWEGEIDPVWREVAELLPPEVATFIPDEGTGE